MRLPLFLAASTFVLAACGGTEVQTAEPTDADPAVAYENDTAALPDADEPPLEGDSPFVGVGADDAVVQDGYASAPVSTGEVREPIDPAQAGLAGQYDLAIDGRDRPAVLMVEESATPGTYTGTLDGEPVEIARDGDRFTFDAPVETDGEEALMTFSGLSRDGRIEDGLVESQGDGRSMGYTATRADAAMMPGEMGYGDPMDGSVPGTDELGTDQTDLGDTDLGNTDDLGADDPLLDR